MSASRINELSARLDRPALGDCSPSSLNNVPPAFGMRTYCAWPPGSVGMPKRHEWMQRQVNPMRQKLHHAMSGAEPTSSPHSSKTYWHSPHDTVNGDTTLSPTRSVEYSSGLPVASARKLGPRATTSPTISWPQVRLRRKACSDDIDRRSTVHRTYSLSTSS